MANRIVLNKKLTNIEHLFVDKKIHGIIIFFLTVHNEYVYSEHARCIVCGLNDL